MEDLPLSLNSGEILEHRRKLNMRQGLVTRLWRQRDPSGRITSVQSVQFLSLADRQVAYRTIEIMAENYTGRLVLDLCVDARVALVPEIPHDFVARANLKVQRQPQTHLQVVPACGEMLVLRTAGSGITVAAALSAAVLGTEATTELLSNSNEGWIGRRFSWTAEIGEKYRLDKFVCFQTSRESEEPAVAARRHVEAIASRTGDRVLAEHKQAWARVWSVADIEIDGAPELQRAIRFAIYHLGGAANPDDEWVSIGARGLAGSAYNGHVFWDTDVFMLPFFILCRPEAARALVMYRFHTLPAARAKAQSLGYRGALYPWESADGGREATPAEVIGPDDAIIQIEAASRSSTSPRTSPMPSGTTGAPRATTPSSAQRARRYSSRRRAFGRAGLD